MNLSKCIAFGAITAVTVLLPHKPTAALAQEGKQGKGTGFAKAPPLLPGKNAVAFEVASIKPNKSGTGLGQFAGSARGLILTNYKARMIIRMAFGNLPDNRISGGPDWMDKDAYDIEGVFAEGERAAPPDMYQPVLRSLLASRFGMKWHFETKEFPIYELVVAKSGSKLTPNTDGLGPGGTNGTGAFTGHKLSMAAFANRFPRSVGRVVVDKTGLTGEYDFALTWDPSMTPDSTNPSGPSIFTAIEEQLGLRLQSGKAPLEVLVIDNLEKPTEN